MKIRLLPILCILLMSLGIQAQTAEFETAAEAVKNMKVGWSYPISLESGPEPGESLSGWQAYETLYGNPLTKPELMKLIRKAGYNAVRLPITWFFHMDSEGNVDIEWMHRIHEIVDYVIDQNMYCIINAHHDTADGWLRADMDIYNQVHKRYEFLWKQISEEFKDYDHHLVFEAYNEMLDNYLSWGQPTDEYGENHIQSSYDALNKYAQSFVNAVRSTGGNNLYRNLVVCTYGAQHRGRSLQELIIPKDEYPDHLIMEVHCYPDFRTVEESKAVVDDLIAEWANAIEQKKCPMLIGEWGPWHRDWITESDYAGFADYFIKKTKEHNIATFDWIGPVCNGQYRKYPAIENTEYVKAVMKAYYGDSYDPIMLTTEDYNDYNKVTFTEKNAELTLLGYGAYDLDHYIGYNLELANDPALNVLQIKAYGNEGEQLFDVYSKSTSVSFDKTKLGTQLLLVTLQNKQSDQYIVSVDRGCILLQGGDIKEEEVRNHWGCDLEFAPSRKQFVHTVEYDGIWTELNLFDDNIPLKLKNYKGIRVEFAEPINVDDFIIKVYADNGAVTEGRAPNSSISTALLFSDFNVNDVINRVTLQYCKEGKAKTKVVSAWLIRQDGTEEYSDLSPFWGCEIKEKTPYKAAASKEPVYNTFDRYLGGDLSLLPRFEQEGKTYLDDDGNKVDDVLRFLKEEKQFNSIRVRLFVDPSYAPEEHREWGAIQDMEMVKALGKRIKDLGMAFMLDFHYSDTWADPGKQYIPHAWEGLSDEELYVKIYEYTKQSLRELIDAGATPDMIQIGNEVTNGMLWGENVFWGSSDYSWNRFIRLLKEASKACREVCPQAKIIIHNGCAETGYLQYFSEKVKEVDYDIVGLSFYLTWDSFDNLKNAFDMFEREFKEKDVMVVETNQAYKGEDDYYGYPNTEDGQNNYLNDLIKMLWEYPQVKGLYWWLPEGFRQGLWSEETGKPLAALSTMATFLTQAHVEKVDVTDKYLVNPKFDSNLKGWTNTGGTAKWREHVWKALNNFCEFEWTGSAIANQKVVQTITLPAGSYRLSVTCASDPGSSGLYLFAGSYSKEMPGTGGVDSFSLDFIVAKESAITIGMKVENTTATWVNFDNFKLERLESTTDIHGISTTPTKNNTVIYNLWGQKLAKPQKGINIINGKKVLVK